MLTFLLACQQMSHAPIHFCSVSNQKQNAIFTSTLNNLMKKFISRSVSTQIEKFALLKGTYVHLYAVCLHDARR